MFRSLSILLVFLAVSAQAEAASKWGKIWRASLVIMLSASFVDAASSYGHIETNPILASANGRFGNKALALKGGIGTGVVVVAEILIRHKMTRTESERLKVDKAAAIVNFAAAGAFSAAAIYNIHNRK